jgi:hypothetical protein
MLKTVSTITNAIGALNYKGTWNASTNTPALASGAGTKGDYYVVSVAGSTALDGISNWGVGDWAAFNGTAWQRVEGGADLNGVNLSVSGNSDMGNIRIATNTISSQNTNADVIVAPNGAGSLVVFDSDIVINNSNQYIGMSQYTNKKWLQFNYPPGGQFGQNSDCTDFYVAGGGSALVQARLTQNGDFGIRGTLSQSATLNDYAEYFEWSDGNPDAEDRIGMTVVLDGQKIRIATSGDDSKSIVGVVSATAGVALGAGAFEWSGKYKHDDFGRKLTIPVRRVHWHVDHVEEDGSVTREHFNFNEGEIPATVEVPADAEWRTYDDPVVSDNYDQSISYIARIFRKEWACIGLMGQIRVRNGSPIGDRWIKMRDISETVSEYLVR